MNTFGTGTSREHALYNYVKIQTLFRSRLKVFLILALASCSTEQNGLSNFGRGSPKEQSREIISKSVYRFSRRNGPFCSVEHKDLSNFDRGLHKKHSCIIISKSIHCLRRRSFIGYSSFSSYGHFVQRIGMVRAILVEGHPRNIPAYFFKIHPLVKTEKSFKGFYF